MKNYDDIISRFDDIQDLPVTEEVLGAYMEGKIHGSEMRELQNLIGHDDNLSDFINVVENDYSFDNLDQFVADKFISGSPVFDVMALSEFEIPALTTIDLSELISTTPLNDDIIFSSCGIIGDDPANSSDIHHVGESDINNGSSFDTGMNDNYDL